MLRKLQTPLALLILLVAGLPLRAADPAIDAIAEEASLVIRIKKPKASIEKVAELVDQIVPGMGDQLRQQSEGLGAAISNPTMAGVDMESDWYVAMFTDDDPADKSGSDEPTFLFIVPATDLKAMKEALGDSFKFMEHGKLGVYTSDEATAKATAARLKGEGKSISTRIDKDSGTLFDSGDLSVFINVRQLIIDYKDEIAAFKEDARQKIENLPAAAAGAPGGINTEQLSQIANHILKFVSEGLDDTQSCTVAAVVSKEGLSFEDLVKLKAGSATDKLLAKSPAGALAGLTSLPAGHLAYFGLTWNVSDFAALSQQLTGLGGAGLKPETSKELQSALAETAKLKIASIVSAFGLGDAEEGAVRTVSVTEVDNPSKMRELAQKVIKAMEKVETQGIKQTYEFKKDAEKYGKNSADVVTAKTELEDPNAAAFMERFMSMMFGPEGMTTRSVYLKDKVVQTVGGGKQAMTDALAAQEQKPATTKTPLQAARGKLAPKSNVVVLFDLANTTLKILELVAQAQLLGPIPLDADQIKQLQSKPSYFGLSAGTEAQGLRVKTVIPVEQMQAFAKIGMFFQQLLGGAGQ